MRLFIAVQLDDRIKNVLTVAQDSLRQNKIRGNYTDMQNLHLTLAFIGEYGNADRILEAMEQVHFESFQLSPDGSIGSFGDLLWTGLEQSQYLENLTRQLRRSLSDYHIPFDKKKFHPHITLLRKAEFEQGRYSGISSVSISRAEMTVREISLMRSERGKNGMIYSEIGSIVSE